MKDIRDQYYILNNKTPVKATMDEWMKFFDSDDRRVAKTESTNGAVSTVFLGLDHSFGEGPPLLFETMIFGGKQDQECWRCSTWEEALTQHANAVKLIEEL